MSELDFEIIDHTADIGIRLKRSTREALFRDAALAMFRLVIPEGGIQPAVERRLRVRGQDDEQLMVEWLSRLNFLFQTRLFVPAEIDLCFYGNELRALLRGETVDPRVQPPALEIKAVTFHNLEVKRNGDGWSAQVIFDV